MSQRVGVVAAAVALETDRKTIQRWKKREGCPFGDDDLVDVEELRAWAQGQGLLGRRPEDGRPTEAERLAAGVATAGGGTAAPAADVPRAPRPRDDEEDDGKLTAKDRDAIAVLTSGDAGRLLELAATGDLELAKRLAAWGRARAENAEAERRELEVRAKRRELVPLDEVLAAWRAQVEVVKGGFMSLPGKAAIALANAGVQVDLGLLIGVLERELHELLKRFEATTPGEGEAA